MKIKSSQSAVRNIRGEALDDLRAGRAEAFTRLYDMYRGEFVAFAARNFSLDTATAVEVYQDSFVALYENLCSGKLTSLSVSLKTYIFAIGRNKMFNLKRDNFGLREELTANIAEQQNDVSQRQEIAYTLVQQMEEPCCTVLTLYYWERKCMAEIADVMNYAGAQVAKNRKLSCMRKLKSILTEKFVAEGLM